MNFRQLQCVWETYRNDLNSTSAAIVLGISQPNVSKQIKGLENELGVDLFARKGKRLVDLTPAGAAIVGLVGESMMALDSIRRVADEFKNASQGSLSIATTHTQARYVLPEPIEEFRQRYPDVSLHVSQGTPPQLAELTQAGEVDFAIATEGFEHFTDLIMLPCYTWNRTIVVPQSHHLADLTRQITMADLGAEGLVTYVFGFSGSSSVANAFNLARIEPNVVFTATDTDVIKTYVRRGLGIGIIASMAYDRVLDSDLVSIDASHLFQPSTTHIGFRKGVFLRQYMYEFIGIFAENLTPSVVAQVLGANSQSERDRLLNGFKLPHRK